MHLLSRKKKHSPSNSPWSAHAPPLGQPPSRFFRHSHSLSTTAATAGELFLFGGDVQRSDSAGATNELLVISTQNFSTSFLWTRGDIPSIRFGHRAVLTDGILLIWGGTKSFDDQARDDSLYHLNIESREWTQTVFNGPKPSARYYHSMTLAGSKLFVFGGESFGNHFNDIWALDLNRLQSNPFWESYEPAPGDEKPHPRSDHVSVASGDRIIIFGGYGGTHKSNNTWLNDTWSFNISTRKWTELRCTGSIPSRRAGHAAVLIDDRMYVFGGYRGHKTYLGDLTVFNLSAQRWTTFQGIGPSPCKRTCHAMASDGTRVFVLGGTLSPGRKADGTKPIYVLDTKLLNYLEPDVINPSEEAAQLVGKSSLSPPMRGQLYQPSSLSNAHAAHRASRFQKELDDSIFQHITREQNASLNDLPSQPTGASGGPRRVLEDSEDSTEHNAKPVAPSGRELAWSENKRLIELEQQLSKTVVAQTERDRRIGQLADGLAQASEEKKRAAQEQRELQMKLYELQAKLDESLLFHDHALEQAEANAAEEKRNSALELRKLKTKLDESLLSRDQAEANTAYEKKRAELEKRELQAKLDELQAKLDESLLSRNHTVDQPEANAAEEKRHAALELRELQEKLDGLQLSRDQAEANAADAMKYAALKQRELQAELGELLMSRDKHLCMLEQAQTALQKATSRTADADADERSQPACEHETELAELRAELERKKSELAAVRFRLTRAKDGWAKGKARADKSHTVTVATLVDLNEDRTVCDLTEDMQVIEAGLASLKWSEKSIEDMDCGNEG